MTASNWIAVDREGLAQLLDHKGRGWMVTELVQNAWDQNVTEVDIKVQNLLATHLPANEHLISLSVEDDDPNGWADISHAYTMFAPSAKKSDPAKRGRFNMGEKMLLALAETVEITSVTAGIVFNAEGRKELPKSAYRKCGSRFVGVFRLTVEQIRELYDVTKTLISPQGIKTTYDFDQYAFLRDVLGDRKPCGTVPSREVFREFRASLPTMVEKDGQFKGVTRKATVKLYEPQRGESPTLYEMGIPVVELDGEMCWHVDIGQKIPLNMDRDNVTPSYLRLLRVAVLNEAHDALEGLGVAATWVTAASEDKRCSDAAITTVVTERFGDKVVAFDPSDVQANSEATAEGYNVVGGRSLTKGQWANARGLRLILPAGQVTPSDSTVRESDNVEIPEGDWSQGMVRVSTLATLMAASMLEHAIEVRFVRDAENHNKAAWWGDWTITFNCAVLGDSWFEDGHTNVANQVDIITHEFAHAFESNHLSSAYYNALTRLTGKMAVAMALPNGKHPSDLRTAIQKRCGWNVGVQA